MWTGRARLHLVLLPSSGHQHGVPGRSNCSFNVHLYGLSQTSGDLSLDQLDGAWALEQADLGSSPSSADYWLCPYACYITFLVQCLLENRVNIPSL